MKHPLRVFVLFLLCLPLVLAFAACGSGTAAPPSVVTNDATEITASSATLNGELTALGSVIGAGVWFKWGTSSESYTNRTITMPKSVTGPFSREITDLTPNTTYYFRAVAAGEGTAFGSERSFTTLP